MSDDGAGGVGVEQRSSELLADILTAAAEVVAAKNEGGDLGACVDHLGALLDQMAGSQGPVRAGGHQFHVEARSDPGSEWGLCGGGPYDTLEAAQNDQWGWDGSVPQMIRITRSFGREPSAADLAAAASAESRIVVRSVSAWEPVVGTERKSVPGLQAALETVSPSKVFVCDGCITPDDTSTKDPAATRNVCARCGQYRYGSWVGRGRTP